MRDTERQELCGKLADQLEEWRLEVRHYRREAEVAQEMIDIFAWI